VQFNLGLVANGGAGGRFPAQQALPCVNKFDRISDILIVSSLRKLSKSKSIYWINLGINLEIVTEEKI